MNIKQIGTIGLVFLLVSVVLASYNFIQFSPSTPGIIAVTQAYEYRHDNPNSVVTMSVAQYKCADGVKSCNDHINPLYELTVTSEWTEFFDFQIIFLDQSGDSVDMSCPGGLRHAMGNGDTTRLTCPDTSRKFDLPSGTYIPRDWSTSGPVAEVCIDAAARDGSSFRICRKIP